MADRRSSLDGSLQIGQPLPELSAQTPDGKATTVQAHLGPQKTLLYFLHGTWCPECVGQFHLLQRYRPALLAAGADIVVITGDDLEALTTFLASAVPPLEYMVLTDPRRVTYQMIGVGGDTVAVIVDRQGVVRWFAHWPDHQEEPGYDMILQALREVQDVRPADTPKAGQRLPELKVQTATGVSTSIEAYLGSRATLLNFLHGTWCAECVSQLYSLQRHKREIAEAGADIVVVTRDKPEALAAFLMSASPSLEYAVLVDPDGAAHQQVGAGGHTLALVVDGHQMVRWVTHWSDHRDQPGYPTILQALREAGDKELAARARPVAS